MVIPALGEFSLVGGTALSLRYGHRTSIDLDLFNHQKFDHATIIEALTNAFEGSFQYEGGPSKFGIFCFIENIKVDIVFYPHLPIATQLIDEGIRMYDSPDIAAMKTQAILGRGKKKDFWDLAELLEHFSLAQIIAWHGQKYPNQMLLISIPQAIIYFAEADESDEPVSLKGQTWQSVKEKIQQKVSEFLK